MYTIGKTMAGHSIDLTKLPKTGLKIHQADEVINAVQSYFGGTWKVVKLGGEWIINHDGAIVGKRRSFERALQDATNLTITRITPGRYSK